MHQDTETESKIVKKRRRRKKQIDRCTYMKCMRCIDKGVRALSFLVPVINRAKCKMLRTKERVNEKSKEKKCKCKYN